jgi:GNAT superfamily N-acetyltransferase
MPDASSLLLDIARTDAQIEQILDLQRRNLRHALDDQAQARDGFVFVEHTFDLLRAMSAVMPQAIALDGPRLAGYSLAMSPAMRSVVPSLVPMFAQLDRLQWRGRPLSEYDYVVGGQVCVDRPYRGRGLIAQLYAETRRHLSPSVTLCVTEIADRNFVSLRAHERSGFVPLARYRDAQESWTVVLQEFAAANAAEA